MSQIITEYSEPALAAATEQNLITFFRRFGKSTLPGTEAYFEPHLLQVVTDEPVALFNSVLGAKLTPENADAAIDTAIERCKARGVPMLWWVGPISEPDDLRKRLESKGLTLAEAVPGMILDLALLADDMMLPDGLTIVKVAADNLDVWVNALLAGFGMPESVFESMRHFTASAVDDTSGTFLSYLGLLNGDPVAASSMYLGPHVAGIYNVATLEAARGMGIGRAMTVVPLLEAKKAGYHFSMLHSSEMGHSVYRKIGYKDLTTIFQYVWSPPED